jgi:hypothetical protein
MARVPEWLLNLVSQTAPAHAYGTVLRYHSAPIFSMYVTRLDPFTHLAVRISGGIGVGELESIGDEVLANWEPVP